MSSTSLPPTAHNTTAVILAGGAARRMGGQDKGLITFAGRPLIAHVIDAISGQLDHIIINANRNADEYGAYGFELVADEVSGYAGPLAGMLSAMNASRRDYILTIPCDCPFVSSELAARLFEGSDNGRNIAVASDGERLQPVFALIPTRLADDLQCFLDEGERKIDRWYARHPYRAVSFSDQRKMFENLNTPEDLAAAEQELNA